MHKKTIIVSCLLIWAFTSCQNKKKDQSGIDGYYVSTQSQTDDRVKNLGMDKPSENAAYILDTNKLRLPKDHPDQADRDTMVKGKVINEFNQDAVIILKSDTALNGMLVWDVLQSVGLKWGDGDLFHWENPNRNYGDDELFSVWTTTDPGYFLPETIKRGQMNPDNLVFGFSIPRNADPKNVYALMVEAVKYCKKRLGGKILNQDQQSFNEIEAKKILETLVNKMNDNGVVPGSYKAMVTY